MYSDPNESNSQPVKRARPGWLLLTLALLFGAAMALAGFMVGRVTAEPASLAAALPTLAPTADPTSETVFLDDPLETPTEAPSATPLPTEPATALPSATSAPTLEAVPPTPTADLTGLGVLAPPQGSPLSAVDFSTFYEVWDLIAAQYDGELPPAEEIIQAIVSGSLETLNDDYTRYVPADVAERMREDQDGSVEGIGAFVIENDEGLFEIVRPIDGQPADLAGVMAGDVLIEVDGQSVLDLSFDEVILLVRGPQGTSVNLKFMREGEEEPLEFTIVRTRFEVPVVTSEVLPADMTGGAAIGYIHLTEFTTNAEERLYGAIDDLLAQGVTGLVLDLRDNPGGFLDQSVAVADAFLPEGVVLYERNIRGLDETFASIDGDAAESIPLVVLVNAGSASASEIVAGALQDRGRAVLVGETTFGKGSVQQIHPLSDGSELRVTVARWYTPNNNTIDSVGIVPDIEVESPEDLGGPADGQLQRAIEWLLTGE